ncbi:MAG: hypothetical protein ABI310_10455 [Microbacteriaceae bacterium]
MSVRVERTPQQLDPLGTFSAWLLAPAAALIALVVVVVETVRQLDQVSSPVLVVLALLLAVTASIGLVWGALPRRAPFTRGRFLAVVLAALAAAACSTASLWGFSRLIQDDWGQIFVALMIAAMAQLRPPRELVFATIVSAALLGAGAWLQSGSLGVPASPISYAVVAIAVPIVLGFGAAAYGNNMLCAIDRWRGRALVGMAHLEPQVRESVTRSVQQAYVTALNDELAPLVEHILSENELTVADRDAAATIADTLRGRAIGMSNTNWLQDALERALAVRGSSVVPGGLTGAMAVCPVVQVVTPDRAVLDAVTSDLRAVVGAILGELLQASGFAIERVEIATSVLEPGSAARFVMRADAAGQPTRLTRARLRPYLAVLRVISDDARMRVADGRIEVEFSYDLD